MEWRLAGWLVCLPLLIFPCSIKSRSSLLALADPGGPRKKGCKTVVCGLCVEWLCSVCVQVGLLDLEVNTLSKILCVMVILLALVMMIIKVCLLLLLLILLHCESKKGCHPNHGYNFVNSWSICKILSLLKRAVNLQQSQY